MAFGVVFASPPVAPAGRTALSLTLAGSYTFGHGAEGQKPKRGHVPGRDVIEMEQSPHLQTTDKWPTPRGPGGVSLRHGRAQLCEPAPTAGAPLGSMDEPPTPQGWAVTPGHEGGPLGFRASSDATLWVSGGASASSFLLRGYEAAGVGEPAVKGTRRLESPCLAQGAAPGGTVPRRHASASPTSPTLVSLRSFLCHQQENKNTPQKKQKTNLTITSTILSTKCGRAVGLVLAVDFQELGQVSPFCRELTRWTVFSVGF